MNRQRILTCSFLSFLFGGAPSAAEQGAPISFEALAAAGFAAVHDMPAEPAQVIKGRPGLHSTKCGDYGIRRCFHDSQGNLMFSVTYLPESNETVTAYPALQARQRACNDWLSSRLWPGPLNESPVNGRLNLSTLAIPLDVSRGYGYLLDGTPGSEELRAHYRKFGSFPEEDFYRKPIDVDLAIARVALLDAQDEFKKVLTGIEPSTQRWKEVADGVEVGHLEPVQLTPTDWTDLARAASRMDAALEHLLAQKAADDARQGKPVQQLPIRPRLLTAAFFADMELPVIESEQARAEVVRAERGGKVEYCHRGLCVYDENGQLSHWTAEIHVERRTYKRKYWSGVGHPIVTKEKVFITGHASVLRQQKEYNEWMRSRARPVKELWGIAWRYAPKWNAIEDSGYLNIRTLLIPHFKAELQIEMMWDLIMDEMMYMTRGRATEVGLGPYMSRPDAYDLPPGRVKMLADMLAEARRRSLAFERRVRELEPLTTSWQEALGERTDHLEPSQLPEGVTAELSRLQQSLESAVSEARKVEELSR